MSYTPLKLSSLPTMMWNHMSKACQIYIVTEQNCWEKFLWWMNTYWYEGLSWPGASYHHDIWKSVEINLLCLCSELTKHQLSMVSMVPSPNKVNKVHWVSIEIELHSSSKSLTETHTEEVSFKKNRDFCPFLLLMDLY